jgi:NAD(P)-dependent dehydrogenase (short-subunit alcohol dehydrogenase family)
VALITGANKGIGFETARQLGRLGIVVVLGSRDVQKGEEAAAKLRSESLDARALKLDVTDPADYHAAAQFLEQQFGKLDILVNNAGVMLRAEFPGNDTSKTAADVLRKTFEVNFFGPVALTQALLPLLRKSEAGRIVNLSSVLGSLTLHADPSSPIYGSKSLAYDSSKAALNMFTNHLAHELRNTAIKVNSAHPGWVKTDMGTAAAPLEIADGAKTSVALATLPAEGPTGAYIHMGKTLPW